MPACHLIPAPPCPRSAHARPLIFRADAARAAPQDWLSSWNTLPPVVPRTAPPEELGRMMLTSRCAPTTDCCKVRSTV